MVVVYDVGYPAVNGLFYPSAQDHEVRLIWDINTLSMDVSINICEQVIPNIRMEAYTTGSRKSYCTIIMQEMLTRNIQLKGKNYTPVFPATLLD